MKTNYTLDCIKSKYKTSYKDTSLSVSQENRESLHKTPLERITNRKEMTSQYWQDFSTMFCDLIFAVRVTSLSFSSTFDCHSFFVIVHLKEVNLRSLLHDTLRRTLETQRHFQV